MMILEYFKTLQRATKSIRISPSQNKIIVGLCLLLVVIFCLHTSNDVASRNGLQDSLENGDFEVNNYGNNINLLVNKSRYRDVPQQQWKNILFWNDAYGTRR